MTGRQTALVTGGAGLIGSHIVDQLLAEGWRVRVLDSLEPRTHPRGRPNWIASSAEMVVGDICDRAVLRLALDGVDVVFHQAAFGGYGTELAKYFEVNSGGTARLLETIQELLLPVRKVIVASSQAVYSEGAGRCAAHGTVFPAGRGLHRLQAGDFDVHCPHCDVPLVSIPTPEEAPTIGENAYAMSKVDQERLVLAWGRQTGVPTVGLRYSCTYGPRQSVFNPYTGVIAIFSTRILSGNRPVVYEDGRQTRDFVFVGDVARANVLAAGGDAFDGQALNVGSGDPVAVETLARMIAGGLGRKAEPELRGEFRPGEIRALTSDITRARAAGWTPTVRLADGIDRYLRWVRAQGKIADYFANAEALLRQRGVVRTVAADARAAGMEADIFPTAEVSLS